MSLPGKDMAGKFELLRSITNNFTEEHIGSGGYGDVYRATLDGKEVAVKKLKELEGRVNDMEFDNEVCNLINIEHQNIVRLLGYCSLRHEKYVERQGRSVPSRVEDTYRVLVFDYILGGSLQKYISAEEPCHLDWATSYKIIRGICEGLKHLHTVKGTTPIYHMDIKPANILLDNDMTPKIGDLGLSRLVSSTRTHQTQIQNQKGTKGYMPPEYIDGNPPLVTKKFDVFSLGVLIIQMLAGSNYVFYLSRREILPEAFTQIVTEKWKEKLPGAWGYLPQELQVNTCVDIALRCVKADRNERPDIKRIVTELENVENQIKDRLLAYDQSKNLTGFQRSSDSNVIAVDPAQELRFLFEPRKDISCCLQLTNKTGDRIAFNIKTNKTRYDTQPSRGIMPPCSKQYVSVTLRAQEAPPNMPCQDMLHVESVNLSKEPTSSDVEITEHFFEKVKTEKVVVKRPIVLVAQDQLRAWTSQEAINSESAVPMDISS